MKWWTIVAEPFGIRLQTPGRVGKLENVGANPIGKCEIVLSCNGFLKDVGGGHASCLRMNWGMRPLTWCK
jgi:hypothetical protein